MRRTSKVLIFLGILFIPLFVSAANISILSENIILEDDLNVFRYRSNPGLWQRSVLDSDQITGLEKYNENIFITTKDNSKWFVYMSENGLSYDEIWSVNDEVALKLSINDLLIVTTSEVAVLDKTLLLEKFDLPGHTYSDPENYLVSFDDSLLFFNIRQGGMDVFDLIVSSTVPSQSYDCTSVSFLSEPTTLIECNNSVTTFNPLPNQLLTDVELLSKSIYMSFWKSIVDDKYYVYDGENITILEFANVELNDEFFVAGDRLFWQKTTSMFEVAWRSDPVTISQLPTTGEVKANSDGKIIMLKDNERFYYSESYANWVETNIIGEYELIETSQGVISYLPDGSDAYYEQESGVFVEMDSSWSVNSKIKTIKEVNDRLLLILRNSSNNPNIYVSEDYIAWRRITMPSNPTHLTNVTTVRELPANTLVEVSGDISVLPGYVSSNISYLTDSFAGIQLYLSSSKGEMNLPEQVEVTAIGKISSSSVGRILLDSPDHLVIGSSTSVESPNVSIQKVKDNLGMTYVIEGKLSNLSTDSATIIDESDSIKVHLDGIKDLYAQEDVVLVEVVVDYNSSSKNIEAWWTGGENKLIKKHQVVEETPTKEIINAPKKVSTNIASKPVINNKPIINNPPLVDTVPIVSVEDDEVEVLGVMDKRLPSWVTFLSGLVVGGLIICGTRFRKILE